MCFLFKVLFYFSHLHMHFCKHIVFYMKTISYFVLPFQVCFDCKKVFTSQARYLNHLKRKIQCMVLRVKKQSCENCGHIFDCKSNLKYHLENRVCTKSKMFVTRKDDVFKTPD